VTRNVTLNRQSALRKRLDVCNKDIFLSVELAFDLECEANIRGLTVNELIILAIKKEVYTPKDGY
jgi:hypothetical protein